MVKKSSGFNNQAEAMMKIQESYHEIFQFDPELAEIFSLYKRTKEMYQRTLVALGRIPSTNISFTNAKEAKVTNGTYYSTKIYTSK